MSSIKPVVVYNEKSNFDVHIAGYGVWGYRHLL